MSADLERRYRRWLLLYPRPYRRAHGEALVATLLDCARPGQTRPGRAEVADLVRGGLRQRFRLPVGRTILATAVLATVLFGTLGAGAGSWLGWRTATALPGDTAVRDIATGAAGRPADSPAHTSLTGFGAIPTVGSADPVFVPGWSADDARARLDGAGWQLGTTREGSATHVRGGTGPDGKPVFTTFSGRLVTLVGARDGLRLRVDAAVFPDTDDSVMIRVWPEQPATVDPLSLLGLVAGAIGGWLLTGWAGYRLRGRVVAARGAITLAAVAVVAAAPVVLGTYRRLLDLWRMDPDAAPVAPVFDAYLSPGAGVPLLVALSALIGVVVLAARTPTDAPPPRPAPRAA